MAGRILIEQTEGMTKESMDSLNILCLVKVHKMDLKNVTQLDKRVASFSQF
jgi:hypothetical protein